MRNIILPSKVDMLAKKDGVPVLMGLADEAGFPHIGHINFGNNTVSASTGTILVRGAFDNPANPLGKRLLRPGMFVRVRLPLGKPHPAILVAERALQSDQGQKFLMVVNDKNVVEYRRVATGPLQEDGLRVISEGLKPGDRVIVEGLQMVRPEMAVKVEEERMQASPVNEAVLDSKKPSGKKN
jgi:membrane fusion protein, multidrug efflux system